MHLKTESLKDNLGFGTLVSGLTPQDIAHAGIRAELKELWIQTGLIVFRDSVVTPAFQLKLSQVFGELELHPVPELRDKIHPELMTLVSDQDSEGLYEVDGVPMVAYLSWHSDLTFVDRINHGGLLTARSIARWGGQTGFIDQIQAYELLPDDLRREVEGLDIVYQLTVIPEKMRYGNKSTVRTLRQSNFSKKVDPRIPVDYPPVVHPAVFVQPETGRKVLNISPVGAQYILGRDDEAGHALLGRLIDHITTCPAYYHLWQNDEMILWDNWRMLHCVTGAAPEDVRVMQRTTIMGDYGVGRKLSTPDIGKNHDANRSLSAARV